MGEWNGCTAAAAAAAAAAVAASPSCGRVTLAARLLGVEMQHPGVDTDVTVLWCENEVERDAM